MGVCYFELAHADENSFLLLADQFVEEFSQQKIAACNIPDLLQVLIAYCGCPNQVVREKARNVLVHIYSEFFQ